MARVKSNGIELEYETFGTDGDPALMLISGLGGQMVSWDEGFCAQLVERGFRVIRFDNRDVGLSTWFDALGVPDLPSIAQGSVAPPYTLDEMAGDAAGLLDALGVDGAHVVGASMGGFIAQLVAINHPEKVLSLTSIMSGPGGTDSVSAEAEVIALLLTRPPADREGAIEHGVRVFCRISGPLFDEERTRTRIARAYDRAVNPTGAARQFAAIAAAPARTAALARLQVPVLVIHGEVDPLVPIENGRRTAAAASGSRLLTFPDMGHDLPPALWPQMLDAITENARAATPQGA